MSKSIYPSPFDMRKKTVLVIGASGGIGSEFTKLAIRSGANIISASREPERLSGKSDLSELTQERFKAVTLDFTDLGSIDRAVRLLVDSPKPIDSVVFAAGVPHGALTEMTRWSDLREVFEVNAFGPFRLLQGIARNLAPQASCVFVSSVSSVLPQRGSTVYGSSKAALERMALGFALELRGRNVRVNVIRPGPVETEMLNRMDVLSKDELVSRSFNGSPTSPSQIANLIAFLVSDLSKPITGTVVSLDGGW